ncbi:NAD-dependent epimerase/dehydratase family protein [Desulfovibrio sp. OttesenSCG-928-F20]|nr:NAD-dependent epimerase/dehydratase family protein [Desulfovibrio sp. OttesenSCG-928-M16]MDL2291239.1 NAD-dependent epimerase/dehydratase family protein [Desulfovibrio sp. OttesenSCG-928-F20]
MKIIVFGGDGFCGWATSLHLSALGHDILIADNFSRRKIDIDLGVQSLTPIAPMDIRLAAWKERTDRDIGFAYLDVAQDYAALLSLLVAYRPDAVVHFAEQRAAPYSMKSSTHKRYTVDNNMNATHNILAALVESGLDIHLVHLGTMGVYGYGDAGAKIPEGYLAVSYPDDDGAPITREILYPTSPGSVYHLTKSLDQLLFAYYAKNDGTRITDLHQGIVWGTQTKETALDERLVNRLDYDGDYGTVLNRFLMQGAIGYPLTIHGSGGQTRAFIHIQDTVRCVALALQNPPQTGERVKILNQLTETLTVKDLAALVSRMTNVPVQHIPTPRNEAETNALKASNKCFLDMGLKPIKLDEGLLREVIDIAKKYAFRCDKNRILCASYWNKERQVAGQGFRRVQ